MPLREAAEIMVKNSSDVLPVVDQDRLAGLNSWVELLDAALENCSPLARGCGEEVACPLSS